jgi:hypothetical protein
MNREADRVSWRNAEPAVLAREHSAMAAVAPELVWRDDDSAGGWRGFVPEWPFERPRPRGLNDFLAGARLTVLVQYLQAYPMVAPRVYPLEPQTDFGIWTLHDWHVNGDGSLCLLQIASDWTGRSTAADLIVKAAGWFLEFLLLERKVRPSMTECGVVDDDSLDELFTAAARSAQ